ncbi:hypothetical protein [Polynucleobacter sp. JS-Polo-80-F4]|uniref:hypothetical protein n=1 Tax=Polynucleobacter sp. JS-Polo-80-F4 TaxID=2576918 RepID=UPI001C0E30E9|nr:hypothetical protein [Polynucleobacter sp. JS-Polo-80-F4]MBU3616703.1 hypothetical protein [Polynucleobacter sp. JS-Polo-80-F4]
MIFNQTKWRYPLFLAALSVILGFGFLGYRYMQSSPQKITQYEGVALGESKDKVELALGIPTAVSFPPEKENLILENKTVLRDVEITRMALKKEIEENPRKEKGFNDWEYKKPGYSVFIKFDPITEKVALIGCYIFDRTKVGPETCAINKIYIDNSEQKVVEVLGNPASVENLGPTKILHYPNLNMLISMEKNSIFHIQVKNVTKS